MPFEPTAGYKGEPPPEDPKPVSLGTYILTRDTNQFAQSGVRYFNIRAPDGETIGSIRCRSKEEARAISSIFTKGREAT